MTSDTAHTDTAHTEPAHTGPASLPHSTSLAATPAASPPTPAPTPPTPHRYRRAVWWAAAAAGLVVAYLAISWFVFRLSHSITDDAFVEAHIVNVAPEMVSGRIVRFLVEEDDQVEQGQVLAEIEPVHYRDQVEQARGKLELAEAELKRQEAGLAKPKKEVPRQIDVATQNLAGARIEEA